MSLSELTIVNPLMPPSTSGPDQDSTIGGQEQGQMFVLVSAGRASGASGASFIHVSFASVQQGQETFHGSCHVYLANVKSWEAEWNETIHLVREAKNRITRGHEHQHTGGRGWSRLPQSVVYKLSSSVAAYSSNYQGIQEA